MAKGKTVAIVLVACAGLGVLLIGTCAGLLFVGFKNADAAVSPRIDLIFEAIDQGRFAETYDTETTQEFRDLTTKEQYAALGDSIAARLGALKSKTMLSFNMQQFNSSSFIDVTYNAVFENGTGTIFAKLKKENGVWKFVGFRVNSPVFDQDIATTKCESCGEPHTANAKFCPSCGADVSATPDAQTTGSASAQELDTEQTDEPKSE